MGCTPDGGGFRVNRRSGIGVLIALLASMVTASVADSGWVTVQDLLDAILERRSFTPDQQRDLDLNTDGFIDVADIACYYGLCHKKASFSGEERSASEDAGTIGLVVEFEQPITGILNYFVGGTATPGADFMPVSGSVPIAGSSATIPITLIDDSDASEELETIDVKLLPGDGYLVGARNSYLITILENDLKWQGTLQVPPAEIGVALRMTKSSVGLTGAMTSDGFGTLPSGEWPAVVTMTDTRFEASVAPITMPADSVSIGEECTRTFAFLADEAAFPDTERVDANGVVGRFTESTVCANAAHLDRVREGVFVIIREPGRPSSVVPVLTPAR